MYLNLAIGAKKRLEFLKKSGPDWRASRYRTFRNAERKLMAGLNSGVPVWYSHTPQLSRMKYVDELDIRSINHTGWYADIHCNTKIRGFIIRLPHTRFLAGYHEEDSDEYVVYPELFDDERAAVFYADSRAQYYAQRQCEHSQKYADMQKLEDQIEEKEQELAVAFALRHHNRFPAMRKAVSEHIKNLRTMKKTLRTEYEDYL